jgi:hydrophobe/amphiphile efflux-3 (HAE3) family protein
MPFSIATLIVRYRPSLVAAVGAVTVVAVFFATRLQFDFRPQAVYRGDSDLIEFSEQFRREFECEEPTVLLVVEAVGDDDVLDRKLLTWQYETVGQLEGLDGVARTYCLPRLELPSVRPLRGLSTRPLVSSVPIDEAGAETIRAVVDQHDLLTGSLVSGDLRVGVTVVALNATTDRIEETRDVLEEIEGVLATWQLPDGYRYRLTGLPVMRVEIVDELWSDQVFLIPLAGVLFFLVLAYNFRCVAGTVLPLTAVGIGLLWTFGGMAAFGQQFTIISNALPMLLLVIGVANCVHIINRYAEEADISTNDRSHATVSTIQHVGLGCLLATITTAIGFFSLSASRLTTLRDLGIVAAASVVLLLVSSMLVLGAGLPLLKPPAPLRPTRRSIVSRLLIFSAWAATRHPLAPVVASLFVIGGCLFAARDLHVDTYMLETYDEDHPMMDTLRVTERAIGGFLPIEISVRSETPGTFHQPDAFGRIARVQRFAANEDAVLFTQSLTDLHRAAYRQLRRRDITVEQLADPDARVAAVEDAIQKNSRLFGYRQYLNEAGDHARIHLRVRDTGSHATLALVRRLKAELAKAFPESDGYRARLTGAAYVNAVAMDGFVRDLFYSLLGACVVMFVAIGASFRSLRVSLFAILPNLTPLIATLGYIAMRGYVMNAGNVIVFAISLGIATDGTIHVFTRFREELAMRGDDVPTAVLATLRGTGRAVFLTCLIIVAGMSILTFSEFLPTRRFAELTSITMAAAVLGDLVLLPALLVLFWRPAK